MKTNWSTLSRSIHFHDDRVFQMLVFDHAEGRMLGELLGVVRRAAAFEHDRVAFDPHGQSRGRGRRGEFRSAGEWRSRADDDARSLRSTFSAYDSAKVPAGPRTISVSCSAELEVIVSNVAMRRRDESAGGARGDVLVAVTDRGCPAWCMDRSPPPEVNPRRASSKRRHGELLP